MALRKCYEISLKLDDDTSTRARKELGEKDSKQVASDIQYIRDWILKQQDYLNSKVDDEFILAFLRAAKYSYSRTQELIRNYWTNRTEIKDWFHGRSYDDDSVLMEIADLGLYVKLPFVDKEGRIIILQRMGQWDPEKYNFEDVAKYIFTCVDVICEDPRASINGILMFLDMSGLNTSHLSSFTTARAQKMTRCLQDAFPMRLKGGNYYNTPKLFDAFFAVIKVFLKEKLRKRLKFHGSDLKSLHKEIPKSLLPKEYGGELESIKTINDIWVEHIRSRKSYLLDLQNFGVDLAKVPKIDSTSKSNTAFSAAASDSLASPSTGLSLGTFRKLNVD